MKKFLILALLLPVPGAFAWTNPEFRIANKNISVELNDDVSDGCWTNLGEVRRYAEDKLSNADANVVSEHIGPLSPDLNNYWFSINVLGYRLNSGVCIGSIETNILSGSVLSGVFHLAYVQTSKLLVNSVSGSNLNNQVLNLVGDSIREID